MDLSSESILSIIHDVLLFPIRGVSWVFTGEMHIIAVKTVFLLLPALLLASGIWSSLFSLPSLVFRSQRTKYSATLLVNWIDSARATVMYWGGLGRFAFLSIGWIFGASRIIVMGSYQTIKDVLFSPITIMTDMAKGYAKPGIPWIAVTITMVWIIFEAVLFSMILTPTVSDILTDMTNVELYPIVVSSGLFLFLSMFVGGSLACMHGLMEAIQQKKIGSVIKMLTVEVIVAAVEVVFFYREFVESVIPFFNRFSEEGLHLGPAVIISLSFFAWIGIRSAIWFFFAKYGTPTLLMVISREGMEPSKSGDKVKSKFPIGSPLVWIKNLVSELREEINWFTAKGEEMLNAFFVPPLQIISVMANFLMLLLTGRILISIPLKSVDELKDTKALVEQITQEHQEKLDESA